MFYKRDWLIFLVIFTLIFLAAGRTALDVDMWWHLRAGEETVKQGFPLLVDHLSFTRMNQPWTNHSWLSQVIMLWAYQLGGFTGLGIYVAGLAALSMGLLYFQMAGKPIVRAFVIVLGALVAAVAWSPRPQMISWLLISLTGLILFQNKWKHKNLLWVLPIIFVFWSNFHGGYIFGLILVGVNIAGDVANRFLPGGLSRELSWQEIYRQILILVLCGLAALINPNGINMWLTQFQTVGSSVQFISEWASPDFHQLFQQPLLWLLFASMLAMGLSKQRADMVDLLSIIVFGYMALTSRRFYGPFALVITPILSRYLWLAWLGYRNSTADMAENLHAEIPGRFIPLWQKIINLCLVGFLFGAGLVKVHLSNNSVWIDQTVKTSLPAAAVDWIKHNKPEGNMLNEYNWGGYLSWALKEYPVFIDGRADLYEDCGIKEWMNVIQAGEFWMPIMDGYKIGFVLLEPHQPVVKELLASGWRQAYLDASSIVLLRPGKP